MKRSFIKVLLLTALASLVLIGCGSATTQTPAPASSASASTTTTAVPAADVTKSIADIKAVLPKFAIPMREVADHFDNMYYAAKGGNWALAAYMSKYTNAAMNPASLTKPVPK